MKGRTFFAIPLIMGLLLLLLGCVTDPPLVLQPTELCSDHLNSDIATFEDPNMERAVRGARNDLTCGLVFGVEGIDLTGYGITSLVGIQNLTSLVTLYSGNNQLTDISPLNGLTELTYLILSDNSISDARALSGLTRLRELDLRDNSITDIRALGGLTGLTFLFLDDNSISDINPLSRLTGLRSLRLPSNLITDASALSGLTGLSELRLDNNSITDIGALRGLTALRSLRLGNNPDLADIQPLLDNPGLGPINPGTFGGRDLVDLSGTNVSCTDVATLIIKGVDVVSDCP